MGPGIPVSELLAAVNVGEAEGVLRLEPPPEASDGPSVEVVGNHALVSGGAIFVSVTPDAELDKLLLSIDMQSYYEIDLTGAMSPYRLVGHVPPGIEAFSAALSFAHGRCRGRDRRGAGVSSALQWYRT